MRVLFRADASLDIGNGHVVRCLTLAQALKNMGAKCEFVCRLHPGHLTEYIDQQGFLVHRLPVGDLDTWLGVDWKVDAQQTLQAVNSQIYDWLIVDHYGLDAKWEISLSAVATQRMAIDDLANRSHAVDVVLDQNMGRTVADYVPWVQSGTEVYVGPMRALLRPEFSELRAQSMDRRLTRGIYINQVLVTMGGVDKTNVTAQILRALRQERSVLDVSCELTVIMGPHAPWLDDVRAVAATMPWQTEVCVNVSDMAERMVKADLAISAFGTTAWERCALGLPTLGVVIADNQLAGARYLEASGATVLLPRKSDLSVLAKELKERLLLLRDPTHLRAMQEACFKVTDALGVQRILQRMQVHDISQHQTLGTEGSVGTRTSGGADEFFDAVATEGGSSRLRVMQNQDLVTVLRWRNHPTVKKFMLNTHEIGMREHLTWFERVSVDSSRMLLIYERRGVPMGFVQFSGLYDPRGAEWGFYLAPQAQKGTGRALGTAALKFGFIRLGISKIIGEVLPENAASIKFHQRLGFEQVTNTAQGRKMLSFELDFKTWLAKLQPQSKGVIQ
jgi:UDP-2,4-diacetamido-2,4,6-trideoxy-beta-L-altropyranose hydrolase/UDP-4-amino-4,6-dideoxy-N-acetyl-beta-L-altrosamine N-acetyltransferase